MQMCHSDVDAICKSIVPIPRLRSAEDALCPELLLLWFCTFHGMISCLHVDFECFKLALWPTLRQKFMNFWSFLTRPGDKHDEKKQQLLFNSQAGPSLRFLPWISWFLHFSHDKTRPNLMVFSEISFWNEMFLCSIKMRLFTVAES